MPSLFRLVKSSQRTMCRNQGDGWDARKIGRQSTRASCPAGGPAAGADDRGGAPAALPPPQGANLLALHCICCLIKHCPVVEEGTGPGMRKVRMPHHSGKFKLKTSICSQRAVCTTKTNCLDIAMRIKRPKLLGSDLSCPTQITQGVAEEEVDAEAAELLQRVGLPAEMALRPAQTYSGGCACLETPCKHHLLCAGLLWRASKCTI